MNVYQKKKPEKEKRETPQGTDDRAGLQAQLEKQVSWAAGTEKFSHRDPSFHLSEDFSRQFDLIGKRHAAAAGQESAGVQSIEDPSRKERKKEEERVRSEDFAGHPWFAENETDMGDRYVARYGDEDRLKRFSEIGFKRGSLSSAILNGTGKMMLVSCLKRTVGQENAKALRERKLFQMHSDHRLIPQSQQSLGIVNKGFMESAVGMVVDVTKDARRSLDNMEKMALGEAFPDGKSGTGTLWKMYPFLDMRREQMLLAEYNEKLKAPSFREGSEERALLLSARERVISVLRKKEQEKRLFLEELRLLRKRAVEAELLFSEDDFLRNITREEPAAPPEDGKKKEPRPAEDTEAGQEVLKEPEERDSDTKLSHIDKQI